MFGTVRILIAEDQMLQRDGLRAILSETVGFEVLPDDAADGLSAIRLAREHSPHVVIMDVAMPRMNGIEATREIKRRCPDTNVLIVTVIGAVSSLSACIDAGASGYLQKTAGKKQLIEAVRTVAKGETYFDPDLNETVPGLAADQTGELSPALANLTNRERQILKLIAEGYRNREVAESLGISIKTVEAHRANFMRKLDLHNAAEVSAFAHRHGMSS